MDSNADDTGTMSEREVKDLKAAFSLLDKNCDGRVNASELKSMMETLGISVSDDYIEEILKRATQSGEGLISEEEFMQFMSKQSHAANADEAMEDLVAAFRVFDKDQNGYITRDELRQGMEMIGEPVTESSIDAMLLVADIDKDGKINYEEFARMLL